MRLGWRQFVSVFAMYVIALNTILFTALAPIPASGSFDPLSVICHTAAQDASQQADSSDSGQPSKPNKACFHCTLCCAAPAATTSADSVIAGTLEPGRLLGILAPADLSLIPDATAGPHLARGPPHNA